jgi:hypothetical protein
MTYFNRPDATLDRSSNRRTVGSRLADFGDRIARAIGAMEPERLDPPDTESPVATDVEQPWEQIAAPFPAAEDGYDRAAVDRYIAGLEQQLAEHRSVAPADADVDGEIARIGEQTSAILLAAHDQAQEITRRAQTQADRLLAEAASRAMTITEQSDRRLRELDVETESVWRERTQLLDDVRHAAAALSSIAEESAARFPAEPARADTPTTADSPTIGSAQLPAEGFPLPPRPDPYPGGG